MKNGIIVLILVMCNTLCMSQTEIMKNFVLGDYSVGFRSERIIDYSRSYDDSYRSVQLFVWYPTKEKSQKTILYEQYFGINDPNGKLLESDSSEERIEALIQQEVKNLTETHKLPVVQSKYKVLQTIAQLDAPVLKGDFPLLLVAPGGNTSNQLHSVIGEYLASHGYIVASFPSLGNVDSSRWPFNQIGLNIHIDDMALVINHLKRTMSQVHIDKTGLMAWSVGGVSQGIYSMKNSTIDLLISLDSGLGRVYGVDMLKESPYFDYSKFKIPYLHMTGNQPEMYKVDRSSEFYDSISSVNKHSLVIEHFAHQHFASQLGVIPAMASEPENRVVIDAYISMCRLVLNFSNIYLKEEISGEQEWLKMIKEYSVNKN